MAHDVFISYSADDKPIADAMCSTLESNDIRCWIAPRDIVPGMDWGGSIIEAIGTSRVMVLLLSSNSNVSKQVKREVERAVNKGVIVIPFRIEDVSLSPSLEYQLSLTHWMDALTPPMEKHLQTLSDNIRRLLSADSSKSDIPTPKRGKTPVELEPSSQKRLLLYLGTGAVIGVIILVGLVLWWGRNKSTSESVAAVSTTSPTPAATPTSTPRSEQDQTVNNQNQNTSNNAEPESGVRIRIPVINGTTYDVARELLIREGWQPNEKHISYGNDPGVQSGNGPTFWKRGYRELVSCSGSGAAECLFEFIDPSERVLLVVTQGEEADDGEYHATVKRAVFKKKTSGL